MNDQDYGDSQSPEGGYGGSQQPGTLYAAQRKATPAGAVTKKTPPPALGRPDLWPNAVYLAKPNGDSFLKSANEFHTTWGFNVATYESLESLTRQIAYAKKPTTRVRVISHATDGFLIPLFDSSPTWLTLTQRSLEALNAGDGPLIDELLGTIVDLSKPTNKGVPAGQAVVEHLETSAPAAIRPFGYSAKDKLTGDKDLVLRRCADLIAVAPAAPELTTAVRRSLTDAGKRLGRSRVEVDALAAAVRASGFTFTAILPQDVVDSVVAAIGALDKRNFRQNQTKMRANLKDKWVDFRGCRIGDKPPYLQALAVFMGCAGCTAPDLWMGFPGTKIGDQQLKTGAALRSLVSSGAVSAGPALDAMNRWGARLVPGWTNGDVDAFFSEFLDRLDGAFAVYVLDTSGSVNVETHTVFWKNNEAKGRWLEAMWDAAPAKTVQRVAREWGKATPRMPTIARELVLRPTQEIFVAPEPEYRDHIKEVPKA